MDALEDTLALIRRYEGLYLSPYLCPAGVPTIGYGSTRYANGTPVALTDPAITAYQAEELLLHTVKATYLPAVLTLCPVDLTPGRLAALVDFCYNLGAGALRSSTLRKRVNAGDWGAVPAELRKWDKAGGRVLRGLTLRRNAEAALV
jgi:lysozyme